MDENYGAQRTQGNTKRTKVVFIMVLSVLRVIYICAGEQLRIFQNAQHKIKKWQKLQKVRNQLSLISLFLF